MNGVCDLHGQRILVTQASEFMGPMLCTVLAECGAQVLADHGALAEPGRCAQLIAEHGRIDTLLINLSLPAPATPVGEVDDTEWERVFDTLVHPLPRLVRAVLPQMREREGGKILVMGSASALRGMPRTSSYSAARGAQLAYVQAAGVELAREGIQLNAIAQNFVENPTYFPPELQANPKFQARLAREVPLGRLVREREDASFAAMLCSDALGCFVGQIFPVCGGWVAR